MALVSSFSFVYPMACKGTVGDNGGRNNDGLDKMWIFGTGVLGVHNDECVANRAMVGQAFRVGLGVVRGLLFALALLDASPAGQAMHGEA